jgi:hypothetical protein
VARLPSRRSWLSLREALATTARLAYPDRAKDAGARDVQRLFLAALDTDAVTVLLHNLRNPGSPKRLLIEELHHPYFRLRPEQNALTLGEMPDIPFDCQIDRDELSLAVVALIDARSSEPSAARVEQCQAWLASLMSKGPPDGTRAEYELGLRSKFGLTQKEFARAWNRAKAERGELHGWGRPGRRKHSRR